jgi:hypothetical protein
MADKLNEVLSISRGIRKTFLSVPLKDYIGWLMAGKAVIEDWNREEVGKRPGDANQLLYSLAMGWSMSMFLGHWDGILPADNKPVFTAENPLKITEGGHRSRWIQEIAKGDATLFGNNIPRIHALCPELCEKIMNYRVRIEITTHESGKVPLTYTKGEYKAINTLSCPLTTGETLRASTDDNFNRLNDGLKEAFKNRSAKMDKMARDKSSEILAGLIQIIVGVIANEGDSLKPSKEALVDLKPTEEMMAQGSEIVESLAEIEAWLKATYGTTKGTKQAIEEAPKLEFFGPLIYGLTKAGDDRATAMASIQRFYMLSLNDAELWKQNSAKVRAAPVKGSNGGGRLNRKRYEFGWNQLLSVIAPPLAVSGEGAIVAEE